MASPGPTPGDGRPVDETSRKIEAGATALEILGEEARPIDPQAERRVLRKIDSFLMPAMVIGKLPRNYQLTF